MKKNKEKDNKNNKFIYNNYMKLYEMFDCLHNMDPKHIKWIMYCSKIMDI